MFAFEPKDIRARDIGRSVCQGYQRFAELDRRDTRQVGRPVEVE
jgi:hypothetical protein